MPANLGAFIADAGIAAGSAGGVKTRPDHGAKKDQADRINEHGEDFEQLVAGADKVWGDDAEAGGADAKKAEAGSGKSRSSLRTPGAAWHWPEPGAKAAIPGGEVSEETQATGEDASAEALPDARRMGAGVSPGLPQREPFAGAREGFNQAQGQRPVPGSGAAAASGYLPESTAQSGFSGEGGRAAPQVAGIVMQPGKVEPAAAQLAAVLARGSEAGKGAQGARGTVEAPKIQVSLAETHFSPVKPDSELEAYDLARRIGAGRVAEGPGRSLKDGVRLQGDVRPERPGRAAASQRDVRAEQLAQNSPRVPVAGDVGGQIGTRILQELEPSRLAGETRAAGPVHVKQSDPVLKVLEIRLEPRELGTVLVRMSLRDNVLQVELGFGKSDAAATIAKNTDQLTQYLRSSGYIVEDIVVRVVDGDRAPAPVAAANPGQDAGQGSGGSSTSSAYSSASEQAFDEGSDQRPSGREARPSDETSGEGSHGQDNPLPRSDSGLFV